MSIFKRFWRNKKGKSSANHGKKREHKDAPVGPKIPSKNKPRKRRPATVHPNKRGNQNAILEQKRFSPVGGTPNTTAAIYVKDASEEQVANLRSWVVSQGITDIVEFRETTPLPRHSDMKEFGNLCRDAEKHKFNSVFIISLKNIDFEDPTTFLLLILSLKKWGVSLVSQAEPWTNMSIEDMRILFLAYCLHEETEKDQKSIRSKSGKVRYKKNKKPDDDNTPNNA